MSNNKQDHIVDSNKMVSSVDWLVNHWKKLQSEDAKMSWNQIIEITELVKAKHREELIEFADDYVDNCVIPNENMAIPTYIDVPEFYNETFGKDE